MKRSLKKHLLSIAVAAALPLASAQASVVVLDFEGISATYPFAPVTVGEFYNGGTSGDGTTGTNYGVSFGSNALGVCLNTLGTFCTNGSRGGLGDPNSQRGGLFFLDGSATTMNVAAGFETGFSFFYSAANQGGSVQVFDGLDGTGNLLTTLNLTTTTSNCGAEYGADFCPFVAAGVNFVGIARSVNWGGVADQVGFDDVTFGSSTPGQVPVPGTLALVGLGLVGLTRLRRRQK